MGLRQAHSEHLPQQVLSRLPAKRHGILLVVLFMICFGFGETLRRINQRKSGGEKGNEDRRITDGKSVENKKDSDARGEGKREREREVKKRNSKFPVVYVNST